MAITVEQAKQALNAIFQAAQLAPMPARDHNTVIEAAKALQQFINEAENKAGGCEAAN